MCEHRPEIGRGRVSDMRNRHIKGHRNAVVPMWMSSLVFIVLCLSLTGCDGHFLSLDCVGSSGYCKPLPPTPTNAPMFAATARVITAGKPLLTDPLNKQDGYSWADDSTCNFHDGAYYVTYNGKSSGTYTCDSEKINYQNAAIAMDVTLISGNSAGIIFRASHGMDNFYEFMVSQEQFVFGVFRNNDVKHIVPVPSTAIHGVGKTNRLLVTIHGDDFKLFINGSFVGEVQDDALPAAGFVGVSLAYNPNGEARFSNLAIYPA